MHDGFRPFRPVPAAGARKALQLGISDPFEPEPGIVGCRRGRVFAVVGGIMTLSMAFAFAIGGFVVEATGWRPVFVVGGLVVVGCAIVLGIALRGEERLLATASEMSQPLDP